MVRDDEVFAVDNERYHWRDVVLAAERWSDWSAMERQAREGSAADTHAATIGASLAPEALDDAGREFRYDRDLITAQSMEEWLDRWHLTVRDWTAYLTRVLYRAKFAGELDQLVSRYPLAADQVETLTLVEAICSGALGKWKRKLAARAAVHATAGADASGVNESGRVSAQRPSVGAPLLALLGGDADSVAGSLGRIERIEASFRQYRSTQLTERVLREYVGARQLDWMRFDCRVMAFPDEGMAAEAALLLTEDDEGFTGVYSAAHAEPRAAHFFLDDIGEAQRDRFIGARAGDLVGPLRVKDEYVLYLVLEKILPAVGDPVVRKRAEDGVLQMLLDRQVSSRVRWHKAVTA